MGGPQGPADRFEKLSPDATPFEKAVAQGLDALDLADVVKAEQFLQEANALNPSQAAVLVGLGRVYVRSGRFDESLQSFGEAIKKYPDYMPAWHYNGMAHLMTQDYKRAAESWEYILKNDPAYAQEHALDRRVEVAKRMAKGR